MKRRLRDLPGDSGGNIAVTFAVLLTMLITAVGMSLDYARAYNYRTKMQSDLDSALVAVVKDIGTVSNEAMAIKIQNWFAAQTDAASIGYAISDIQIDATNHTLTAKASMAVPTMLMKIANIDSLPVSVASSVTGISTSFLNVYIVLDKSASMLLPATTAEQTKMLNSAAKCAFACHEPEGATYTYNKKKYYNNYDLSKAMGVTLRTDTASSAISEVLKLMDSYDSTHSHIKVGFYTVGKTATQVMAPTFSTTTARAVLIDNTKGMTSATSENATYFDLSFTALKTMVGTAGNGTSAASPLKLVLLLTDGVQSERNWVLQTSTGIRFPSLASTLQKDVTPLNPAWCAQIKGLNATFGILYTEYLPMTWDWGYNATVGATMSSSNFLNVWGGTFSSSYNNSARRDYLPVALAACATSSSLFLKANSTSEIQAGLSSLFKRYFDKVRVTN